jgi:hypothetical protein
MPDELAQTLCATVAGGCGRAETPDELVEMPEELAQTLCATVAGGRGRAETLDELVEMPEELAQTLCATVAGGAPRAAQERSGTRSPLILRWGGCLPGFLLAPRAPGTCVRTKSVVPSVTKGCRATSERDRDRSPRQRDSVGSIGSSTRAAR